MEEKNFAEKNSAFQRETRPFELNAALPGTNNIANWSKQGYQFLKKHMFEDAKEVFFKILDLDPGNNYALVGLGDAERKGNRFFEAVKYYQRCLTHFPSNNFALFGLADCYKALDRHEDAIRVWEQYLVHDNANITVLTRVADSYRKIRNYPKAKLMYLQVLELDPDNAYALIGLGHLCYNFNEYEDALFYWTRIVAMNPNVLDIRILTSIGNCYRKLRRFIEGVQYFTHSLELEPRNFYALFGIADCYRGMNQSDKAIEYWKRILVLDPRNKVILTRAGDASRSLGDYNAAAGFYNQALDIEFDTYALVGLARISIETGKIGEAIESLRRLIQSEPANYRLYMELANCHLRLNERRDAVGVLRDFQMQGVQNQIINTMLEHIELGIA
ncbi:MAG: tetratricopeptide repeat protein [Treponema sp.]|jgi:tetratricopeptide (TPR) repeat protein|nr:tetratricopeptide repeat protein [Treponema sp.]